jgi:hypothetical protein
MSRLFKIAAVLILAYLVLINYTGFSRDVATLGTSANGLVATFQGRGNA